MGETVGRDVSDLIFERLAQLEAGGAPIDSAALLPRLATRWERLDSLTLRFHLRPGARWHDSVPVTAEDVVFSFAAYADPALDSPARATLAGMSASAQDDSTVLIRFRAPHAEQWYRATWVVRVLPRHIWSSVPRSRWASDPAAARPVGSGPYRLSAWNKGQSLTLERVEPGPMIRQVTWRFAGNQEAALNLLLSHEADLMESVGDSGRVARVRADSALLTIAYPSAVYGFLGFNFGAPAGSPVQSRDVRLALALATDRATAARAALGPGAVAPPGPMSRILWVYDVGTNVPPYNPDGARQVLDSAGWRAGADGIRRQSGRELSIDILVPGTSLSRRNLAQIIQEMWRRVGIQATVTSVDFPVFQQRLRTGQFESYIGAQLDEPSPTGLADQWTSAGIGGLNYSRYRNLVFDSLFRRAAGFRGDPRQARQAWREALDTLNWDLPALWLYNPTSVAGLAKRFDMIRINPYSWLSGLPHWGR